MTRTALLRLALASAAVTITVSGLQAQSAPRADHHQHLFSPGIATLISPPPPATPVTPITARDLVALLDAAGIRRAVVLSVAYIYGSPTRTVENEYEKVRAENDWTSQQVAQYPDRLRGFCSVNPLKDYALEEIARCTRDPRLRTGLKLHFGNSGVDVHDAGHVAKVRAVFRSANEHRMAIVVHMRASFSLRLRYGREEARIFLNEFLPQAPDVPVQIAHLAGAGNPMDPPADEALGVFVEAIAARDPRTRRLLFDVTSVVLPGITATRREVVASLLRQIGLGRILYGSDAASGQNVRPKEGWDVFQTIPLTEAEFRTIARNTPPYLR